ncbi:MAG: hypothetical protein C0442_02545 [Chlorobiaceae bacterium]|nr:hypothetical protein [Chlorobiaceae bacterium]
MIQFLLGAMLLFITTASFAQTSAVKGTNQVNVGVGFSNWGVPIYLGFDHYVSNDISLGLEGSFRSHNENHHEHNIIGFSGNGNYHFNRVLNIPRNFDFYAGLNIGYYSWTDHDNNYANHNTGLGLGAQVGGRYFFSSKAGINLEFGGGNAFSGGKFGLTIKL